MRCLFLLASCLIYLAQSEAATVQKNPLDDPLSYPCELPHNPIARGCSIDENECYCGIGCKSEFMFQSIGECRALLATQEKEPCVQNPCNHGGKCAPITEAPWYSCDCNKTGYFGSECQNHCPWWEEQDNYPFECNHLIGV